MDRRFLLVGSIFIFTLLLMTPSIPAIQLNTSNTTIQRCLYDLKTEIQTPIGKNIPEPPERHVLLFLFVMSVAYFRMFRVNLLVNISTEPVPYYPGYKIIFPILYFKACLLLVRIYGWCIFWQSVSYAFGWGWDWSK